MEEQLISFETAKLAEQKGFKNESEFGYNSNGELGVPYFGNSFTNGQSNGDLIYESPTQSLLQKWLREVHEISIKIDDYYTNSKVRFDYNICELGSQDDNPTGIFKTYEEAFETALHQALLLIKSS